MSTVITGTGHHVPARVVTNEELAPRLGTTPEWIEERTGIRERRFAAEGDSTSGLAEQAARYALADAGLGAEQLDAIIFATLSPDVAFPGSGVFLQRRLGVPGIPALDVRNQCSGFLYGLSVARGWLAGGTYSRVLLVGSEIHSTALDLSEEGRSVSLLFGDGAAAVVLERHDEGSLGVHDVTLGADGRQAQMLWCEYPGSKYHPHISVEDIETGRHHPQMRGRTVFRDAVARLSAELEGLFEAHGIGPDGESDTRIPLGQVVLVPHQANRRINEMVASRLGVPDDRVVHTIERFGNTTAASIPMALDIARRDGRITPGTWVVMAAFGSGYTWGTALIRM